MPVTGWGGATLQVDISFDGSTWVDVTGWLRGMTLTMPSRQRGQDRYDSAQCTLTLDNRDGRFSPFNAAGPYHPNVRPRRRCRVQISYPNTTMRAFLGWNEEWQEEHPERGRDNVVTVTFFDALMLLSQIDGFEQAPVGAGDTLAERVDRILAAAGNPGGMTAVVFGQDAITFQPTTLARNTLEDLFLACDSVAADMWVQPSLTSWTPELQVRGRYARAQALRSLTSQMTYFDSRYVDVELRSSADELRNEVALARAGGTAQVVSDATSIAQFQRRRWGRSDLVVERDAVVAAVAEWHLLRFANPDVRISSVTLQPQGDPPNLWAALVQTRLQDRVTVQRSALGGYLVSQDSFIAGMRHDVTPDLWRTTLQLESCAPFDALGALMIAGVSLVVNDGKVFRP